VQFGRIRQNVRRLAAFLPCYMSTTNLSSGVSASLSASGTRISSQHLAEHLDRMSGAYVSSKL